MNRRPLLLTARTAGLVSLLTLFASCSSLPSVFQKKPSDDGLVQVDDLLTRIEKVHVESVLAKERSQAAMDALRVMVATDFGGDPAASLNDLMASIDASEKQANELRKAVGPMKKAADVVFEEWTADLEDFTSEKLRRRSLNRLEATRERYEAIVAAVEPAMSSYDAFNTGLHDHALFLSHDFNSGAVSMIEGEVRALATQGQDLTVKLDACLVAAQAYVRATALRGQIDEDERPAATSSASPAGN